MVSVMGFAALSNAQDTTMTTTTMNSSAKVFGGRAQYRTWSLGLNAGVMSPVTVLGGSNDFTNWDIRLGYGATLRKQFGHAFGIELGFLRGDLEGNNEDAVGGVQNNRKSFETEYAYSGSIMGVANVATVDFLKRENNVNFLVKAGYGIAGYAPSYVTGSGAAESWKGVAGDNNDEKYVQEQFIPVGLGIKFKVSERVNFDLGYNMYFLDGDNLDGTRTFANSNDKYSYGYGGLEISLGSSAKPNLDWVNPVALMYDELKDPTLRQEVEALKGRVSTIETTVSDLLKDTDGDGVADKLDKCPNTEAGIKVDGSGCPLDVDADGIPDSKDSCPTEKGTVELNGCPEMGSGTMAGYNNIQFEFNSSVLRTSAYPALDKLSSDVRANTAMRIQLDGHASAEGTEEYNMQLSKDRANAVKTYLVNSGVSASNISTRGYGETRPVASNATEEGKTQNRRVEFRQQ
jgi:OOP family OmpA-OmpF porin